MLPEAQLYHYTARAYDPALGRFAQTDPAGYASDINPYAYVGNDPVNGTDPSGMVDCNAGTDTTIGCTITLGPPEIDRAPRFDSLGLGVFGGVGGERGDKSGGGKGGHDYRVRDEVCRRQLTNAEGADLLSRYAVPNTYEMGYSLSNGEYFVTNQAGMFGGFVQTTFSAGGLVATNVTTPVHVFVGTIVRSIASSGGASYINTHGFGNSGPDIGVLRDDLNMDLGPGLFKFFDENAAAYAKSHYPGC